MLSKGVISVIIPFNDRFSLLDQTVKSVYEQTYRPIELILVDDKSQSSYQIKVSSDEQFSITVLKHEENRGPGASRETGRRVATGDFIAYLDSDDLWHPEKLEKQVSILQANPDTGMCYCSSKIFSELPLTGSEAFRKRSNHLFSKFLPTILYGRPWDTSACLWTKTATEIIGAWYEGWTWEDYEYDFRAGCNSIRICFLPENLCYYRVSQNDSQLSRSERKIQLQRKTKTLIQMDTEYKKFYDQLDLNTKEQFPRTLYMQAMHLFYIGDKSNAVTILNLVRDTAPRRISRIVDIVKLLNPIIGSSASGDILYRYRNQWTPKQVESGE